MTKSARTTAIASLLAGSFLSHMNSTMVVAGLSSIRTDLGASDAAIVWIVTVYLIAIAIVQPIAGRLGDVIGYRSVYLSGIALFTIACSALSLTASFPQMIVMRALQGIGYALLAPNAYAIVRQIVQERSLHRVFGIYGATITFGSAFGLFLGGILIQARGWPSIFWIPVPLLLFCFMLSRVSIPEATRDGNNPLNPSGAIGSAFSRSKKPLLPVAILRVRAYRITGFLHFLSNMLMYSALFVYPLVMETVMGLDVRQSGILLAVFSLAMAVSAAVGGYAVNRISQRRLVAFSYLCAACSFGLLWGYDDGPSMELFIAMLMLGGFGGGLGMAAIQTVNSISVHKSESGVASGVFMTARYIGGIMASTSLSVLSGQLHGYYALLIALALLGVVLTRRLSWRDHSDNPIRHES